MDNSDFEDKILQGVQGSAENKSRYYWYSAQECSFAGDAWMADREMIDGEYFTPIGIYRNEISIEDLSQFRSRLGYVRSFLVGGIVDNADAFLSIEPLDPSNGRTIRDPQVVLVNSETGQVGEPNSELTRIFYQHVKGVVESLKREGAPEWQYARYIREETEILLEHEIYSHPERR